MHYHLLYKYYQLILFSCLCLVYTNLSFIVEKRVLYLLMIVKLHKWDLILKQH